MFANILSLCFLSASSDNLHQQRKDLHKVRPKHLTLFSITADPDATIAANFFWRKL